MFLNDFIFLTTYDNFSKSSLLPTASKVFWFVLWTPISNWNNPSLQFFKKSSISSSNKWAVTSKWYVVYPLSFSIKNSIISFANFLFALKVLSINLICDTLASIKFFKSLFTLSVLKYLRPFIAEDKQYWQLNGHPLDVS